MGIEKDDLKKIQVGNAKSTYKDSLTEAMTFYRKMKELFLLDNKSYFLAILCQQL